MAKFTVCGVNSMGSTWYLGNKDARSCTVWSGAPKENRATYSTYEEAKKKATELDKIYQFGSTRHYVEEVEE